jgi:hypothetical protein
VIYGAVLAAVAAKIPCPSPSRFNSLTVRQSPTEFLQMPVYTVSPRRLDVSTPKRSRRRQAVGSPIVVASNRFVHAPALGTAAWRLETRVPVFIRGEGG